jgi:hypothetical protein
MPYLVGFSVLSAVVFALIHFLGISISSEILLTIIPFAPFVGLVYIVAGWILDSGVRVASGVSLVSLGIFDLGLPETANAWLQLAIVVIGALTPL